MNLMILSGFFAFLASQKAEKAYQTTKIIVIYKVLANIDRFFLFFGFWAPKSDGLGWSGSSPDLPGPPKTSPDLSRPPQNSQTSLELPRPHQTCPELGHPRPTQNIRFWSPKAKKAEKANQYLLKRCKLQ